jgi:hypothetical protein
VRNPVPGAAVNVRQVIRGTQADEVRHRIGHDRRVALFTIQHPVMTRRGLIPASEVRQDDEIFTADAKFAPITTICALMWTPAIQVQQIRTPTYLTQFQSPLADRRFPASFCTPPDW